MSDPKNSSTYHTPTPSNPKILIAGAGLGGLTLAILLERASIDYEIFERSTTLKPLGSATSLAPNVMPLLEQLGLLDELKEISLECMGGGIYKESPDGESLELLSSTDISALKALSGYASVIMSRPDLHALLLSHVPSHKIHLGKRVLSISQDNDNGVLIRTSDGLTHECDILVGSDGAYSGVRQSLYNSMKKEGSLPSSDGEEMKVCHMSILGTTNAIDPSIMPLSKDGFSRCDHILGYKKPHSWRYFEVPGNRICWRVDVQLQSQSFVQSDSFKNSDWGSESSGSIQEDWRSFKLPLGVDNSYITVGELINSTDSSNVTKVMLEEKLYTTWHHRRTVLMGDACHKMLPNAGRGAVNAMLDAVILANAIYEIAKDATYDNIISAFKEYYSERFPQAKADLDSSKRVASLVSGQTWTDNIMRKITLNLMPSSMMNMAFVKTLAYRPQASFLPKIEYRGSGRVDRQKESKSVGAMVPQVPTCIATGNFTSGNRNININAPVDRNGESHISKINDVVLTHPLNEDSNVIGTEAQRKMVEIHEKVGEYVADDLDTSQIRGKPSKAYPEAFILAKTIYNTVFKVKKELKEEELAINPSESQALIRNAVTCNG
ncbi:hypothetical protein BGX26_005352, partial [Mortierella sp. AD094]